MRSGFYALVLSACAAVPTFPQAAPLQDTLLDHLVGSWVLHGSILGKETTHDVVSNWILGHQYVEIHEVSREKNDHGQPQYEATVMVGWDASTSEYQCLWLDSTGGGGLSAQSIGRGKRSGDTIPFLWKDPAGTTSFNNTFSYDPASNSWTWKMDNVEHGKNIPFARLVLVKKK